LLIGTAGAAYFYFAVFKPAREVAAAASAAASSIGATVSVGSSGVTVNIPGLGQVTAPTTAPAPGAPAPSITVKLPSGATTGSGTAGTATAAPTLVPPSPSGGLATGGPSCDAAAACCKAMASKAGGQAQTVSGCDALKSSPEFACAQALATYKKMAPLVGVSCP
jgi:hypothetical protein